MLCVLYVLATSTCLTIASIFIDYALPAGAPRRWLWSAAIAVSVLLPIWSILFHTAPALQLWDRTFLDLSNHTTVGASPLTLSALLMSDAFYHEMIKPVLLLSSATLLAWGGANALWLRRVVASSARLSNSGDGGSLADRIDVTITDSLGPATVGIWRSQLLLPRWVFALPQAHQQYLLRHEEEHRRAHDSRLLAVASILISMFGFNLPLWWQLWRLRLAVEMDCDRRVVMALGDSHAYGELLFRTAQAASRGPRLQLAFLGGPGMLERRMVRLLGSGSPSLRRRVVAFAAGCVLLIVTVSLAHPIRSRHGASDRGHALAHAISHSAR